MTTAIATVIVVVIDDSFAVSVFVIFVVVVHVVNIIFERHSWMFIVYRVRYMVHITRLWRYIRNGA